MGQCIDSMVANRRTPILAALFLFSVVILAAPDRAHPEFFRYMDKDGKVHYVDDVSRIPPEYRQDAKTYTEPYDHLSESEKAALREKEQRQAEEDRRKREAVLKQIQPAKDKALKDLVTRVSIRGNHVLVPVQLEYGRKKATAMLVLDTGAEIMVLHEQVAEKLHIRSSRKAEVKVAGGRTVPVKLVQLSCVQAGPHRKNDIHAVIMAPEGELHYEGLLGMNFLKDLDYKIDFQNQVIQWRP